MDTEGRGKGKKLREDAKRKTEEETAQGKKGKWLVVGPRGRRRLVRTERVE